METLVNLLMNSEQKKTLLLLKLIIFSYHGLDPEEKKLLGETAESIDGQEELDWAYQFADEDQLTAFERARDFFKSTLLNYDHDVKVDYIKSVWTDTNSKGFVSEIEAMSMLKLAKDWGVQKDLLAMVRKQ